MLPNGLIGWGATRFKSSLGGSFEQVAELLDRLRGIVPVAACIDTCHTHVAGYDIVSEEGLYATLQNLDATVGFHNVKVLALQGCQGRLRFKGGSPPAHWEGNDRQGDLPCPAE